MPIRFQCPQCEKWFSVKSEYAGKKAKCPCGAKIVVPSKSIQPQSTLPGRDDMDSGNQKGLASKPHAPQKDERQPTECPPIEPVSSLILCLFVCCVILSWLHPVFTKLPIFEEPRMVSNLAKCGPNDLGFCTSLWDLGYNPIWTCSD